jgi:hypothetical protein
MGFNRRKMETQRRIGRKEAAAKRGCYGAANFPGDGEM